MNVVAAAPRSCLHQSSVVRRPLGLAPSSEAGG